MRIKKGLEMVEKFKTEQDAKVLAEIMENFVNSFTPEVDEFIEGIKSAPLEIKNKLTLISIAWIGKLKKFQDNNYYDGRNEYSVKTASEIFDLSEIFSAALMQPYLDEGCIDAGTYEDGSEIPFEIIFAYKMSISHRTLQQTFSSIVFKWLSLLQDLDVEPQYQTLGIKVNAHFDYRFYKTPMI